MNGAKAPETPSPVLQEKTVTPETLPTVIGADEGYDGLSQVTVNPDAQLKAENIRSGKSIFGVSGSFVGEPSLGVDFDQITGKGVGLSIATPLFISEPFHTVENPTPVSSPFGSSRYYYVEGDTEWVLTGYGLGGIAAKENDNDMVQTISYTPDVNWYEESGVIGGVTKFEMTNMAQTATGSRCSHVKGTFYLCPVIGVGNFPLTPSYSMSVNNTSFIDKPNISIIEVDQDLTFEYFSEFTITLPEVSYTLYGYAYGGNIKYTSMGYALIPIKVLIS